jgi:hypothetical protein
VEDGTVILIGATTENPSFEVNGALLSRCKVFVLHQLSPEDIGQLVRNALSDPRGFGGQDLRISDDVIKQCGVESCSPQISVSGSRRIIPGNYDPTNRECFSCSEYVLDKWGTYQIVGSVTFDGVTKGISPKNVYITGLPYRSADFRNAQVSVGGSNASGEQYAATGTVEYWQSHGYQVYYYYNYLFSTKKKAGVFFSPVFHLPYRTKVNYESAACFFSTGLGNTTLKLFSGATSDMLLSKDNSVELSRKTSNSDPSASDFKTFSATTYMSANSRISFETLSVLQKSLSAIIRAFIMQSFG